MGSTSTPVYYKGYVYVGTGTGPGPSGGFAIVKENAQTGALTLQRELTMPGSTQGSPLLSTAREAEGTLYFYECANYKPGGLICIRVNANRPESTTASDVFTIFDAADYPEVLRGKPGLRRRRHHLLQKRLRLSVRGRENASSGGQVYPASAGAAYAPEDGAGPYGDGSGGRQCGAQPSVGEVFR